MLSLPSHCAHLWQTFRDTELGQLYLVCRRCSLQIKWSAARDAATHDEE